MVSYCSRFNNHLCFIKKLLSIDNLWELAVENPWRNFIKIKENPKNLLERNKLVFCKEKESGFSGNNSGYRGTLEEFSSISKGK